MNEKRIMVDMSCTLIHHGHIRLLKKASKMGKVIVALTSDDEIFKRKGYWPELDFNYRKEVLEAVVYVSEVVQSKWLIDDDFVELNRIDALVHGDDNSNTITKCEMVLFPRTKEISSSSLRDKSYDIIKSKL